MSHGHVHAFEELVGRVNDMVTLPGGRAIHSVAFLHCIHQEPTVLNGQLVIDDTETTLRLVAAKEYDTACETRIRHRLNQLDPSLSQLRIERAADLETSVAGKRRWFVDKRSTGGMHL